MAARGANAINQASNPSKVKSKAKHHVSLVKPSAKKSNIQVSEAAQASMQEQMSGFLGKHHSSSD